jgi:hypothetical protein
MNRLLTLGATLLYLSAALLSPVRADETPPAAKILLATAGQKAKTEKKAVLVMFHASW